MIDISNFPMDLSAGEIEDTVAIACIENSAGSTAVFIAAPLFKTPQITNLLEASNYFILT